MGRGWGGGGDQAGCGVHGSTYSCLFLIEIFVPVYIYILHESFYLGEGEGGEKDVEFLSMLN